LATLAWFTRLAPSPLAASVASHGRYLIHEAITVSEVLYLMEHYDVQILVIDATVEDDAAHEMGRRFMTVRLQLGATVAQILWELSGMLDDSRPQ
jgi:hypothetical protein